MTAQEARQAAATEGLTLVLAANATGFKGVSGQNKRFQARLKESGRTVCLGTFDTAEEAALCYARHAGATVVAACYAASCTLRMAPRMMGVGCFLLVGILIPVSDVLLKASGQPGVWPRRTGPSGARPK